MKLIIVRGLPGSGKSTLVEELVKEHPHAVVCSADNAFVCGHCQKYHFRADFIKYAHMWCQDKARAAMQAKAPLVIIDNTNTTAAECFPYVSAGYHCGYEIEFMEPVTPWKFSVHQLTIRNTHGVPRAVIEQMYLRYEKHISVEKVLAIATGAK